MLGVVVGCAIYWGPGFFHSSAAPAAPAGGPPVSVSQVVSREITQWTEFSGRIEAVDAVDVRPRVSGQIMAVYFKDGADVKKGQPLFLIDPRPYQAEVTRTKGALAAAESAKKNASLDFARAKQLIKIKAISQAEFEQRTNSDQQAIGNADAAKGAYDAAQVNLDYTRVLAPISGKISRAELTVGNLVDANSAPLMASIVALSPIYASFELDEQTFLATIQGVPSNKLQTIPVQVGLSNEEGTPIQATIHSFDNQIVPGSGTIRVRALIANKDQRLVPGLFARVRIGSPDVTQAILINPAAVGTDQNKKFVLLVAEGNKAEYREVTLGGMVDGLQIVKKGLSKGDTIVVNGIQRLRPGAPLTPQPVDMLTLQAPGGDKDKAAAPAATTPAAAAK